MLKHQIERIPRALHNRPVFYDLKMGGKNWDTRESTTLRLIGTSQEQIESYLIVLGEHGAIKDPNIDKILEMWGLRTSVKTSVIVNSSPNHTRKGPCLEVEVLQGFKLLFYPPTFGALEVLSRGIKVYNSSPKLHNKDNLVLHNLIRGEGPVAFPPEVHNRMLAYPWNNLMQKAIELDLEYQRSLRKENDKLTLYDELLQKEECPIIKFGH